MNPMNNPFENIEGVLFDLDGTLVETHIDFSLMKYKTICFAKEYGFVETDLQRMDILAIVDLVVAHVESTKGTSEAETVRKKAFLMLEDFEIEPCRNAREIPNACMVLDAMRGLGLKVGIVTRNCRSAAELSMAKTGVYAEVVLTRDDVRYTKPHPEQLISALSLLGVDPAQGIMIGDHWMDVLGGIAAGMKTVGFLGSDRPEDFFSSVQPDILIRDLGELIPLIQRLKN